VAIASPWIAMPPQAVKEPGPAATEQLTSQSDRRAVSTRMVGRQALPVRQRRIAGQP
jgi:hypothetical protein